MNSIRFGVPRQLAGFARDQRGVSAVEFALVLPLMIMMYLGVVEITQGIDADRKVTLTTRTVADLASQAKTIDNNYMTNLLKASSAVIAPYDASQLKVTVSGVKVDANGVAKVAWSDTLKGTIRGDGSTVTLPAALKVPNSFLVLSEVSYTYKPAFGYLFTGTLDLSDQIWMRPRLSDDVKRLKS